MSATILQFPVRTKPLPTAWHPKDANDRPDYWTQRDEEILDNLVARITQRSAELHAAMASKETA